MDKTRLALQGEGGERGLGWGWVAEGPIIIWGEGGAFQKVSLLSTASFRHCHTPEGETLKNGDSLRWGGNYAF